MIEFLVGYKFNNTPGVYRLIVKARNVANAKAKARNIIGKGATVTSARKSTGGFGN